MKKYAVYFYSNQIQNWWTTIGLPFNLMSGCPCHKTGRDPHQLPRRQGPALSAEVSGSLEKHWPQLDGRCDTGHWRSSCGTGMFNKLQDHCKPRLLHHAGVCNNINMNACMQHLVYLLWFYSIIDALFHQFRGNLKFLTPKSRTKNESPRHCFPGYKMKTLCIEESEP